MKVCTTCNKRYEDGLNFCTSDGTALAGDVSEPVEPPPFTEYRNQFEITLGNSPMSPPLSSSPPTGELQMPPLPSESPGQLRSFGGLERLGPVGKLKKFFFGN